MRGPRRSGKSLASQGPQAKTNGPAVIVWRSVVVIEARGFPVRRDGARRGTRTPILGIRRRRLARRGARAARRFRARECPRRRHERRFAGSGGADRMRESLSCGDFELLQRGQRVQRVWILVVRNPQHAGATEIIPGGPAANTPSRGASAPRPAGVDFVRTVAHADDARFAAGAGARIRGAVGVEQNDGRAGFCRDLGGPRAENSSADDGHVKMICGRACVDAGSEPASQLRCEILCAHLNPSSTSCFTVRCERGLLLRWQQAFHVFCEDVGLEIDGVAERHGADVGVLRG